MDKDAQERRRRILEMEMPPRRWFRRPLSGMLLFLVLFAGITAITWELLR